MLRVTCTVETYPIAGRFVIARGAKIEARVVVASVSDGANTGRGECVPYARFGETIESVVAAIEAESSLTPDRASLQTRMPAGAARNAIDCALWDYEAKTTGRRVSSLAGLPEPGPAVTAYTISVDDPAAMAEAAARAGTRPLLKIKLAGAGDEARLVAVRTAAPGATLIVDANEAWSEANLAPMMALCADLGVALIEQPLPAGQDARLGDIEHRVPVCADESSHARHGLAALRDRYDAINIKLDKTGGLTEALHLVEAAETLGFSLMVGCMVGTSLAMAPALLLASRARFVDLDGPLLLARDRPGGLRYDASVVHPAPPSLWG